MNQVTPKDALAAVKDGAFLLDVREPAEWDIAHVEGATLIPMRTVPARLDEIPNDKTVYVLCHHGGRSAQVTMFLSQNGRDAVNIAGGIEKWAVDIDPSLARY